MDAKTGESYGGFEQGPIRPPSEAHSLLIRVTRNCPWNRCTFCPVYKRDKFSLRPVEHVKRDIELVYRHVEMLRSLADRPFTERKRSAILAREELECSDLSAFYAAYSWVFGGRMRSVFLQDANSLAVKPTRLVEILTHLKAHFPSAERVTSYARSDTVARRKDEDLQALRRAGLTRIHIGLESGSDRVLELTQKGVVKAVHIEAGLKVRRAGIELSEYYMPGLGGAELSEIHALESADALNRINPDFIRLRTLALPESAPLFEAHRSGRFQKCSDVMVAKELLLFIEHLEGITSYVASDHILNLFADLEGKLPEEKGRMQGILRSFLSMDPELQCLYQVGRRMGIFARLADMEDTHKTARAEEILRRLPISPENVDAVTDDLMRRFV